ncbi:MAG TPA: amidase [Acidimicrobiales bacterium]|nr:amidase [Acidimicrobiales bacterium]
MNAFIQRLSVPEMPPGAVRVAVKDLIDMAGLPTTNGSKVIAAGAEPAAADAACMAGTRRAEAEGRAVIVGKTNMHELAFGVTGINPWFGTPVNPIDASLVPGGSSSGSAVAVATGEADVAFGSDTGGSVRMPAACCGIVGLKTTRGRIPLDGVYPLAPSLDTVGPMAPTVAATSLCMSLLEPGFDPTATAPAGRIGRVRLPAEEWMDAAIDRALGAYAERSGATVTDVELPGWEAATHAVMVVMSAEAWQVHRRLWEAHRDELSPDVSRRLEMSSMFGAEEVAESWEVARAWADELKRRFAEVDLLALPVLAAAPPTLEDGARLSEIRYVAPFNLAGTPALSQPLEAGGRLPAPLQLAGPAGAEELIMATGAVIEDLSGWSPHRDPAAG